MFQGYRNINKVNHVILDVLFSYDYLKFEFFPGRSSGTKYSRMDQIKFVEDSL